MSVARAFIKFHSKQNVSRASARRLAPKSRHAPPPRRPPPAERSRSAVASPPPRPAPTVGLHAARTPGGADHPSACAQGTRVPIKGTLDWIEYCSGCTRSTPKLRENVVTFCIIHTARPSTWRAPSAEDKGVQYLIVKLLKHTFEKILAGTRKYDIVTRV